MLLLVAVLGPSEFLGSVRYALYRLFLNPPHIRGDLVDVLSELHVPPITIGIFIWSPAVLLGGGVCAIHAAIKR
jgi:hypothetical protein